MNSIGSKKLLTAIIALVILLAALLTVICFLLIKGGGSGTAMGYAKNTVNFDEERRKAFQQVFDANKKMLDNIVEYGDEYCAEYVSVSDDPERHRAVLDKLKELSEEVCGDADTDLEKVQRIEHWTADNLYYNFDAAETSVNPEIISLEHVLETKTATCAGYSNMFSALCGMQGIYCVNLRGGTYIMQDTSDNLLTVPMNHEWNAVMLDGEWLFIDTTWLSNNMYSGGEYVYSETMDTEYTDMDFEQMSYMHRIDLADYRDFAALLNYYEREN